MITITNGREVKDWIGVEMSDTEKQFRKIMAQTALTIMDFAKRIAPVITGRYRSSIHIEFGGGTKIAGAVDLSGNKWTEPFTEQPGDDEIFVGTNVIYAGKVEDKHNTIEQAATQGQWYLTRKVNELSKS